MPAWYIIVTILITSASVLAGVFLGAWITFRCLKTEPMLVQPDLGGPTDTEENEGHEELEEADPEEEYENLR